MQYEKRDLQNRPFLRIGPKVNSFLNLDLKSSQFLKDVKQMAL